MLASSLVGPDVCCPADYQRWTMPPSASAEALESAMQGSPHDVPVQVVHLPPQSVPLPQASDAQLGALDDEHMANLLMLSIIMVSTCPACLRTMCVYAADFGCSPSFSRPCAPDLPL